MCSWPSVPAHGLARLLLSLTCCVRHSTHMRVVSVAIGSEFESYYMEPVNFHRMVLRLHYCRDPKNPFQISPEGCVMDRGVYQHHPAWSLHLEKNKWLKLGDVPRWMCLGVLSPSYHRSQSDISCHVLLKLTASGPGWKGTPADQGGRQVITY